MSTVLRVNAGDWACRESLLRNLSEPVTAVDGSVRAIIDRLRNVLADISHGAGIAAIQIGIPLQIAFVNLKKQRSPREIVLINPVVLRIWGRETERTEGCLSLPDYKGFVTRHDRIVVETTDLGGRRVEVAARGSPR